MMFIKKLGYVCLSSGILLSSVSSVLNIENNVYAEDDIENIEMNNDINYLTNKDMQAANILKDYIRLQKKNGIYQFDFYNDISLELRLKELGVEYNTSGISEYIAQLNTILAEENGHGELTDAINQIRNNRYINNLGMNDFSGTSFRNVCSLGVGLTGYGASIGYGLLGIAAGGGPPGWIIFGIGTAIGGITLAASEIYC